ncbi:MAG: hypothetical protein LBH19_01335 [Dysgonamonadaceae bacterium]|nr:hypothetical protein [Dysgonamonadaceae bacterium]
MKHLFFTSLFCLFAVMVTAQKMQDFENIVNPKGDFFVDNPNFAFVELADNPLKTGINTSDKVAAVVFTTVNSGIIKISFVSDQPVQVYPKHPEGLDELYYDVLRFKYYSAGKLNKNIEFEPNGSPTSPKTIVQPGPYYNEEWAYVTIPLANKTYSNFQIRVNRSADGGGSAAGTEVNDKVYLDDFEMYNSTDGPKTAIKLVADSQSDFSCVSLADGNCIFKTSLDKKSDVRVEVVSLDGRSQVIYNSLVEGNLEIPFKVNSKALYCVRMTIDHSYSKTVKIVAK